MPYIEASGISKSFGARHVLDNISLSIEQGEFVSIVGAMGSGKSTLLSLLAGLTKPDRGEIRIAGKPLDGIHRSAAFVFQNYSLLPWLSALDNVRLAVGAAFPALSGGEQRARARETLERVGLGNAVNRRPRQLSGGMRQRVAIARALATNPEILFFDEPFGALDALTREALQQELAQLCRIGERPVTTVMITNSVDEAILLSDRIVPMIPDRPLAPAGANGSPAGVRKGATLGTPVSVLLRRPRTTLQLALDEEASHAHAHIVGTLTAALQEAR